MKFKDYITEVTQVSRDFDNVELPQNYKNLHDAEPIDPGLGKGRTEIWYTTSEAFRDFNMGSRWLKKKNMMPTKALFSTAEVETHNLLGSIKETNLDRIYHLMQGEIWSPHGEARNLIRKMGLKHTSMSVGDVIGLKGVYYMVDNVGFVKLD